jgi:peptidoglycan/LPS O-acetylase OafA/YrhL
MRFPILRRITSTGKFVPEIDGLRFVAIASVVIYHLHWFLTNRFGSSAPSDWAIHSINNGGRGVQLFFVISGFILGVPFAAYHLVGRDRVSLRKYFMRRLTRLEPPYILSMLLLFAIEVFRHRYSPVLLHALGASLLYIHNLIYGSGSHINGVAWSLEVEIQFYCLVPLLAMLFTIRKKGYRRGLIALVMLGVCVAQLLWVHTGRLQLSIFNQIQYFLAGFLLADIYLTDWQEIPSTHWAWDIISLIGWPLMFLLEGPGFYLVMPFLALLLYCATFKGVMFRQILTSPLIVTVGGMCYTIYLLHAPIIERELALTSRLHLPNHYRVYLLLQFLVGLPLLAVLCIAFFVLIERPCMRSDWPKRLWIWAIDTLHGRDNIAPPTVSIDTTPITR